MTDQPAFSDWLAITNLKARYCRMLDTKEWESFAALFMHDAVIDTTDSGGPRFEGSAIAVSRIRAAIGQARTAHQVHAPEIEIEGNNATGIWAMQDHLIWPDGRRLIGYGHYHEHYVRDGDEWKIAKSRLTRLNVDITPTSD